MLVCWGERERFGIAVLAYPRGDGGAVLRLLERHRPGRRTVAAVDLGDGDVVKRALPFHVSRAAADDLRRRGLLEDTPACRQAMHRV